MKRFFVTFFSAIFVLAGVILAANTAIAQVSGGYWLLSSGYLKPVTTSWGIQVPSLANNNCLGTDSTGKFQAGTCSGGSGGGLATTSPWTAGYLAYVIDNGHVSSVATTTSATPKAILALDSNGNGFFNNYLANGTITTSAGGTSTLTAASARFQALTGSSAQTYQLPDATTLSLGPWFSFNNNSSGSLTIKNNGGTTLYTVPAGGDVQIGPTSTSTSNGTWDVHGFIPSTATWGTGNTGLIFNTALSSSPQIVTGASSASSPSFIPYRNAGTTGLGGDGSSLFLTTAGSARLTVASGGNVGIGTTSPYSLLSIGGSVVVGAPTAGGTNGSLYLNGLATPAGSFLAVDPTGKVIATTTSSGGVTSVSNSDGTLTISPTTGAVVASLALSHANTWTALQQFGNATSTLLTASTLWDTGVTSSLLKTDSAGKVLAAVSGTDYAPATSGSSLLYGNGSGGFSNATVSSPLTFSGGALGLGTVGIANGGTATTTGGITNGVEYYNGTNLTNGTGLVFTGTNLGISSSSPAFLVSVGTGSSAFYINSSGEVVGYDTTYGFNGQISPMHYLSFKLATTTAWTGTTSEPYSADIVMPFAGTLRNIACQTSAGTLNLLATLNSNNIQLIGASTTANTNTFTSSYTFTKGQEMAVNAGTPASSPTWVTCTVGATQTP